jgi:hypothetical protein
MTHLRRAALAILVTAGSTGAACCYDQLQPIDQNPSYLQSKVQSAIHALGEGVNKKDFTAMREGYLVSSLFTKRISEQDLRSSFKQFIDGKVDLTRLDAASPILDEAAQVDDQNQITVKGHYPSVPQLNFVMSFIREGSHLGLNSISLTTTAAPGGPTKQAPSSGTPRAAPAAPAETASRAAPSDLTDPDVMAAMLTNAPIKPGVKLPQDEDAALDAAMHAFAIGVINRNMDDFLKQDIVSPRWRQAQTGAQLTRFYRNTIESGADFAKFDGADKIIPNRPVMSPAGELAISGLIVASDQERLGFKAGFEREADQLKLINLIVARSRKAD